VANHWLLERVDPGSVVLDLGCGAGTDLLIAAQMTGPTGRVIGVDMTASMLDRARASADEMG
jgi:arsenite methyltransferase